MSEVNPDAALNELLINVGRSLLQYVGECWPWTDPQTQEVQGKIEALVDRQKGQVAQLVELLQNREWVIDFGTYPTEYTDLHYIALDYLLNLLIQNQEALVQEAQSTQAFCQGHHASLQLVSDIQADQQAIANELRALAGANKSAQAKTV